jgi:hypothetical protein
MFVVNTHLGSRLELDSTAPNIPCPWFIFGADELINVFISHDNCLVIQHGCARFKLNINNQIGRDTLLITLKSMSHSILTAEKVELKYDQLPSLYVQLSSGEYIVPRDPNVALDYEVDLDSMAVLCQHLGIAGSPDEKAPLMCLTLAYRRNPISSIANTLKDAPVVVRLCFFTQQAASNLFIDRVIQVIEQCYEDNKPELYLGP